MGILVTRAVQPGDLVSRLAIRAPDFRKCPCMQIIANHHRTDWRGILPSLDLNKLPQQQSKVQGECPCAEHDSGRADDCGCSSPQLDAQGMILAADRAFEVVMKYSHTGACIVPQES